MFYIEVMSKKISEKLALKLDLEREQEEIIAYGAFNFIQMSWCIFLVIVFGFIFNVLIMSLVVSFTIAILRKYSGGFHASTPGRCAFIGTVICVGIALFIKYLSRFIYPTWVIIIGFACYVLCFYLVNKLAPIGSEKKPISKPEKRQGLKLKSLMVLSAFFIISSILFFLYVKYRWFHLLNIIACIYCGMTWQVFTLTSLGDKILSKLDNFLNI